MAKLPCLLSYVLCLIPAVPVVTGERHLRPHPTGLARPVPRPRRMERTKVQLPASDSPPSKASKYK